MRSLSGILKFPLARDSGRASTLLKFDSDTKREMDKAYDQLRGMVKGYKHGDEQSPRCTVIFENHSWFTLELDLEGKEAV